MLQWHNALLVKHSQTSMARLMLLIEPHRQPQTSACMARACRCMSIVQTPQQGCTGNMLKPESIPAVPDINCSVPEQKDLA